MNVGELRKALEGLPDDMPVIAGSDDEGNDFIDPYTPQVMKCYEDESYRCGWAPADTDDIEDGEYEGCELVDMLVF